MYDAPAFGTAVPDECAAPTTQHIAIRAAPEDRERADGDFTEAVDPDLLWSHSRIRRKRSEQRFLLVLGRREVEQLPARLAGPAAEGPVHGVEGAQSREVVPLARLVDRTHRCCHLGRRGLLIHSVTPVGGEVYRADNSRSRRRAVTGESRRSGRASFSPTPHVGFCSGN